MAFFGAIHGLLLLSGIYLKGANSVYLHLEPPKFQEVLFEKTKRIVQGNNVVEALGSKTDGFLSRDTCASST
jgi:hypothetical protein